MEKIIALLLLAAWPAFAAPADEAFKEANTFYKDGKFVEASQKYQSLYDSGVKNWVVEYDLANAYYRQGRLGKAILYYERAFQKKPSQKDVVDNLALASSRAGHPRLPESALVLLAWKLYYGLSLNMLTGLATLAFAGFVIGILIRTTGKYPFPAEVLWSLALGALVLGGWLGPRIYEVEHPKGIVVSPVAEVRSGPSTTYPANFTIPEGHRVLILETQEAIQDWLQIGVPQEGLRGWVPTSAVEVI